MDEIEMKHQPTIKEHGQNRWETAGPIGTAGPSAVGTGSGADLTQRGSAIVICTLVLVLLSLLGLYATNTSTLEVRIAAHDRQATEAFYAAESGLDEVRIRLPELTATAPASIDWRGYLGFSEVAEIDPIASELSAYDAEDLVPSAQAMLPYLVQLRYLNEQDRALDLCGDGLNSADIRYWGDVDGDGIFEENPLACGGPSAGTPIVVVISWGLAGAGSGATPSIHKITAEIRRDPLQATLFGDVLLEIGTAGAIVAGSAAPNSAHIGGNTEIRMSTGIEVEGKILLGRQPDGTAAILTIADGSSANAHGGVIQLDRMDPDPLGLNGGPLETWLHTSRTENDNFIAASPPLSDDAIDLADGGPQGTAMTLTAGIYHLGSVSVAENCTLTIDNTAGPVTLFLEGPFQADAGSTIQVLGSAENFIIFCSEASQLTLAQDGDFKGCIYAPKGTTVMENGGSVNGMIWSRRTTLNHSGPFSYEPKARNRFIRSRASLVHWRSR